MRSNPGAMRHQVDVYLPSTALDGRGRRTGDPTLVLSGLPCSIEQLQALELVRAQKIWAEATHRVRCFQDPSNPLSERHYLLWNLVALNIGAVVDVDNTGIEVELLCKEERSVTGSSGGTPVPGQRPALLYLNVNGALQAVKVNLAATAAPTAGDDTGDGYATGSVWLDTVGGVLYFCESATLGAAVWRSSVGPAGPRGEDGDPGPAGADGADGATGPAGPGVPIGGTAGQLLGKIDATDYNTQWSDLPAGTVYVDVREYTSPGSYTWTKPAGAWLVKCVLIGAGGGGGSGQTAAAGVVAMGGGGGAPGGLITAECLASVLGATESVVVGSGGAGGAAVSTSDTFGNAGATGSRSQFGPVYSPLVSPAEGGTSSIFGPSGLGGNCLAGSGSWPNYSQDGLLSGGFSSAAGTGAAADAAVGQKNGLCPTGGGGGGSMTTGNVAGSGGAGGTLLANLATPVYGVGGGAQGTDGTDGVQGFGGWPIGLGGGGGGAGKTSAAGAGGDGAAYGGGGGGGGGARNGYASGAGGNGGAGYVLIISYCTAGS